MLRYLGMEFEGTPHRGIDDVKNIIRILMKIKNKLPSSELD
jgi:inhibitor of KinA sporulation pathway (predicted exonuclease)